MTEQLTQQLSEFSSSVRRGKVVASSCLADDKTALYHSLVLGNLQEVVEPCFPILKSILCSHTWDRLLLDFFQNTTLITPIFHQLPFEFVVYLQNHPMENFPYMADLAHYEWIELALELAEPAKNCCHVISDDALNISWQLPTCAKLLAYDYDVHNIGDAYTPTEKMPTFLAVYQKDNSVHFMSINELSFQLLQCILEEALPPKEIIASVCDIYPTLNSQQLTPQIEALVFNLYQAGVLIPADQHCIL